MGWGVIAQPEKYDDPYWVGLAEQAESETGIPPGLLKSVLLHGEKTNPGVTSSAGAKTPFQIIPETRNAILKKYGIDAYLSPENAAEAAALLLKESLARNENDPALAAAEYHGGTDRKNWGPKTLAYVSRVMGAMGGGSDFPAQVTPPRSMLTDPTISEGGSVSTFQRTLANLPAAPGAPESSDTVAGILALYQSGKMSPEAASEFEQDVADGSIMLPRGAVVGDTPGDSLETSGVLPDPVVQAYTSGQMSRENRIQLESDVAQGLVALPPGVEIQKTEPLGFWGSITEPFTGAERATQATREASDWPMLPELNQNLAFSQTRIPGSEILAAEDKAAQVKMAGAAAAPSELAQIIKANYPGVEITQDEKGNFLLKSAIDGQTYAIKPGFQMSDIPRAAATIGAFSPAGQATSLLGMAGAAAGTQAIIETGQAAAGGSFDPGEIAIAGALAPAIPAAVRGVKALRAARRAGPAIADAAEAATGAPRPGVPMDEPIPPGAPAPNIPGAPNAPGIPGAPDPMPSVAATVKRAAEGGIGYKRAIEELARHAAPNPKTIEAAKRLGIEKYLQEDHVTTNQAFREVMQAIKSGVGSQKRALEKEGLIEIGQKADDLIREIGGITDVSNLSDRIKNGMQSIVKMLDDSESQMYTRVREAIPQRTRGDATHALRWLNVRAKNLNGSENLTPMEKIILRKLTPKKIYKDDVFVRIERPTYELMDDVRKQVGRAAKATGPFKDTDTGLAKIYYKLLSEDQHNIASKFGQGGAWDVAKAMTRQRKAVEDDLQSIFGKWTDKSILDPLTNATKRLSKGDADKWINFVKAIPEDMRVEATASALNVAFGNATRNGTLNFNSFSRWYSELLGNKRAYTALMSNLPPASRKKISDLYRVSRGVADASAERITTGRLATVTAEIVGPDTLVDRIYTIAKRTAMGIPLEAATTTIGLPGAGLASSLTSALLKGGNIMKQADELITSPQFLKLLEETAKTSASPSQKSIQKVVASSFWKNFAKAYGLPSETAQSTRFFTNLLQAGKQTREDK